MAGREGLKEIAPYMAPRLQKIIYSIEPDIARRVEEVRIREDKPLILNWSGGEALLNASGQPTGPGGCFCPDREDMNRTLQLISSCSIYAFEEELRLGYLTIPGGHRVGLCGEAVIEKGKIKLLRHITSLNFRIAREITGAADRVVPYLIGAGMSKVYNTLIISPPQAGKTTLLRDICRLLSTGAGTMRERCYKVGLVDERSEIAGCFNGVPQLDVGPRTDVLDRCPKAEGMMMLLRSMSPEIIITDEIGRDEDALAIEEVINAGIAVISSAHASHPDELLLRPSLNRLLEINVFHRIVVLGHSRGVGTVEYILDPSGNKRYFATAGGRRK